MRASIANLRTRLARGEAVFDLLGEHLDAIADPMGQGKVAFLSIDEAKARLCATALDLQLAAGDPIGPLVGAGLGVKDLFDVAGDETRAGGLSALSEPAKKDAVAVERLRRAGMVILGRNNMTEYAYSGLGLNPHYGTPLSPWRREEGRIAGGSTCGGAAAVADGMVSIALGSDTGGSCRIPAAFCGLVGFKPTQARIPTEGMAPLSTSLDSVGWIANSVACCMAVDQALADDGGAFIAPAVSALRLLAPTNSVLDGIDPEVASAFKAALERMEQLGAQVHRRPLVELDQIGALSVRGGFAAAESYAWHRDRLETLGGEYDPRVLARIKRGAEQSAADYIALTAARVRFIAAVERSVAGFDAVVFPTVPILPPKLVDLEHDEDFTRLNLLVLRNSSIVNLMDGCAISLPLAGTEPIGMTLASTRGRDRSLLAIARQLEPVLSGAEKAMP